MLSRLSVVQWVRRWEHRTRPVDERAAAAAARRWAELPEVARTPGQLVGRRSTGCEGTHGVFPSCDFACKPCYHSSDANKVRVDGPHTVAAVEEQMALLVERRGPGAYAQLIGGEVSLLPPNAHAAALEAMRSHGRIPMSMTHGDFDEAYLHQVVLGPDGGRRFRSVSFAAHIDSTMFGRRGVEKPRSEADLHEHRAVFCAMFARLRREHGIKAYLALRYLGPIVEATIAMGSHTVLAHFQPDHQLRVGDAVSIELPAEHLIELQNN